MRVAVFDRYWTTMGGGEQFAGGIVQALARRHDVTMIGPESFDAARFAERLSVDLTAARFRLVADDDRAVSRASADYDLFINCTYLSPVVNYARHGLYVTHFPEESRPQGGPMSRALRRLVPRRERVESEPAGPIIISGFHNDEAGVRWTNGMGLIELTRPVRRIDLDLTAAHCPPGEAWPALIRVGRNVLRFDDMRDGSTVTVDVSAADYVRGRLFIALWSPSFSPYGTFGTPDLRQLGLQVNAVRVDGIGAALIERPGAADAARDRRAHLDTYDVLVSNSAFTRQWVQRLWGVDTEVLFPPVQLRAPGPKNRTIVSIGRFFANDRGHSKKQLEMIDAFKRLHASGRADGWELHLIGGCSRDDREYGLACRRAAVGAPVFIHFNADGADVDDMLAHASIYWHAAGLGEDASVHPVRLEHFGIAIVEAMSARAVPIVLDAGGPAEIVRDGLDGRHFGTVERLVEQTAAVIADPASLATMARSAADRSRHFGFEEFVGRIDDVVARLDQ